MEQIRRKLLYNASCSDDLGKTYQKMGLDVVTDCEGVLKGYLWGHYNGKERILNVTHLDNTYQQLYLEC